MKIELKKSNGQSAMGNRQWTMDNEQWTMGKWQGLLIAYCLLLIVSGCNENKNEDHSQHEAQQEIYTCPMHPQIMENKPGKCPICEMNLVKKEYSNNEMAQLDLTTLLQPTNSFALSQIPVTT